VAAWARIFATTYCQRDDFGFRSSAAGGAVIEIVSDSFAEFGMALVLGVRERFDAKRQLIEHAARAFDAGVGRGAEASRKREIEKLRAKIGRLTVERVFW
jgi:hypothetical protein